MDWFLYNSGFRHERVKGKQFLSWLIILQLTNRLQNVSMINLNCLMS